ncbi:MAG TPA: extracellular solute-binding protein, partial [Dehalococcoidia bacterium]|nr:extracellular solute-binding protein [Dehalococcoidia bacterium]
VRSYSEAIRDSGAAQHGIAIELSGWYIEQWFGKAGHLYIDAENGRSGPATAVEFNDDLGRELFTWLDEMVDAGLALNVGRNPMGTEHLLAVGTGEAAMTIATSAALGSIFQVLESGEFPAGDIEVGVGPMPGIEGDGGILVGGASLWIVNRSSPEEQEAAWTYVKWLNEPEQQARWHEGTGYIPIRKSAVETDIVRQLWTERPQFRIAYDQLLNGETNAASAGPVMGAYREVRDAVVQALERMMLEDVSPEDALSQAEREANAALEEYTSRSGA